MMIEVPLNSNTEPDDEKIQPENDSSNTVTFTFHTNKGFGRFKFK